jgi:hypothetical protein
MQADLLAEHRIGKADHRHCCHSRVVGDHVLDLARKAAAGGTALARPGRDH